MCWRVLFCSLFFLVTSAESTSGSDKMWFLHLGTESVEALSWPVSSAGVFVLVTVLVSMCLIFEHLSAYNQPEEQKFLIGLILMVPVYALESFFSLMDTSAAFNYEVIRDCYEAFALYCFGRYLIACLGGEKEAINFMETCRKLDSSLPLLDDAYAYGIVEHPFPINYCLRSWDLGSDFYNSVKIGIVQYVCTLSLASFAPSGLLRYEISCGLLKPPFQMLLKLICALIAMILESFGVYGEGKFDWKYGYPYLAVILNFSQTWALYCLVQFYSVIKYKLEPIKPLAKFLTFKSIVFLTWWQGIAIAFLFSMGAFKGSIARELKTRIQDYIICIEMCVASFVHLYVFPAVPYKRGERCVRNVAVMADYASLEVPPDLEEVQDCERTTRVRLGRQDDIEQRLNFPQSVCDLVLGSGGIIVDDMKYTVSHVVEPVERGIAKINRTFHKISENVKRHEEERRSSKDDSHVIPLNSRLREFSDVHTGLVDGSLSDSALPNVKRHHSSL